MPRLYREAPLASIWEGSGNVMSLDVLRALTRSPRSLEVFLAEVEQAQGADSRLDARVEQLQGAVRRPGDARDARAARGRSDGAVPAGLAARPPRAAGGRRRLLRLAPGAATAAWSTARCRRAATSRRSSRASPPAALSARARRRTAGPTDLAMMPLRASNMQLARIFGIRIGVSASWFFVLFFLIYWLSNEYFHELLGGSHDDRLPRRGRGRARLLRLADPARARPRARRAAARHPDRRASTCGSSAACRRCAASRRRAGEEFKVAAAGPAVTLAAVRPVRRWRARCCVEQPALHRRGAHRAKASRPRPALALIGWLGVHQRDAVRLQHRARVPARRRAHRARRDLVAHRRPQPRDAAHRPLRPGLRDRRSACSGCGRLRDAPAHPRPAHDGARLLPLPGRRRGGRAGRARAAHQGHHGRRTSWIASPSRSRRARRCSTPRSSSSCATAGRGSRSSTRPATSSAWCASSASRARSRRGARR